MGAVIDLAQKDDNRHIPPKFGKGFGAYLGMDKMGPWPYLKTPAEGQGSSSYEVAAQIHAKISFRILHLCDMEGAGLPGKPSLESIYGKKVFEEINRVLHNLGDNEKNILPANGVVVFELDPFDIDWTLSPEHQWLIAAYLGHLRRLPSALIKERNELPKKSFSISEKDMVWIRSIPPEDREKVFAWYETQVPNVILDIWDEFDAPVCSRAVKDFSENIYLRVNHLKDKSTQVATWIGYQPLDGEVPPCIHQTKMAQA